MGTEPKQQDKDVTSAERAIGWCLGWVWAGNAQCIRGQEAGGVSPLVGQGSGPPSCEEGPSDKELATVRQPQVPGSAKLTPQDLGTHA